MSHLRNVNSVYRDSVTHAKTYSFIKREGKLSNLSLSGFGIIITFFQFAFIFPGVVLIVYKNFSL